MSALSEIKQIKEEINKLRQEAKEKVEAIFKSAVLELFTEYPVLVKIGWTQYTPYFNDGDTCTFGSNHTSPSIWFTTDNDDDEEDEDDFYKHEYSKGSFSRKWDNNSCRYITVELTPEKQEEKEIAGDAVVEFLSNFDDDDVYNLFGDHQKVVITKDGVEAESYYPE